MDRRYREKYGMSAIANLAGIKKGGKRGDGVMTEGKMRAGRGRWKETGKKSFLELSLVQIFKFRNNDSIMAGLYGRQKMLLAVIDELKRQGKFKKTALVKTLFLLTKEYDLGTLKAYSFFPYKYGPFSSLAYADMTYLENNNLILEEDTLTDTGHEAADSLGKKILEDVKECVSRFDNQKQLIDYVYERYPAYTVKSELKPKVTQRNDAAVFTIGYEGLDIDAFLNILVQNEIRVLIDVRHNAFSMNLPFIKTKLAHALAIAGIRYFHFPELGIDGSKRKKLDSEAAYAGLFEEYRSELPIHASEVKQVETLGKTERIALMCFEHASSKCHRGVLAEKLRLDGLGVVDL